MIRSAHNRLGGMMCVVLQAPFGRYITGWAVSNSSVGSAPPTLRISHFPNPTPIYTPTAAPESVPTNAPP
jgi:hypothetical protein